LRKRKLYHAENPTMALQWEQQVRLDYSHFVTLQHHWLLISIMWKAHQNRSVHLSKLRVRRQLQLTFLSRFKEQAALLCLQRIISKRSKVSVKRTTSFLLRMKLSQVLAGQEHTSALSNSV